MTAQAFLTGHTRQQKETARKRGPSLQQKTVQLGQKANIRIVTVYENPTHGVWHIAKYCPAGKTFPDIGRLLDEFTKTGKLPKVRDISRPRSRASPPAAVSRTTRSSRRRKTRTVATAARSIYDVPDDSDSETLCSASILCRPQNSDCEEWGPDESTMADASTAGDTTAEPTANTFGAAADAVGEADVRRECDEPGELGGMEEVAQTGEWGDEHLISADDTLEWQPEVMTGWEAGNTAIGEDTLGWQPDIDMEGWNTHNPATPGWHTDTYPVGAQIADRQPAPANMTCPETKIGDLSMKWAAFALKEAAALQQRLFYCLL